MKTTMTMRRILGAAVLTILVSAVAQAQTSETTGYAPNLGIANAPACSQWSTHQLPSYQSPLPVSAIVSWIEGYMMGSVDVLPEEVRLRVVLPSRRAIIDAIGAACSANPSLTVRELAVHLALDMPVRAPSQAFPQIGHGPTTPTPWSKLVPPPIQVRPIEGSFFEWNETR